MALDSSANLLFTIGANTDDASANVQRFRSLLGTSLSDMEGQFTNWSNKVFGDLSNFGGLATGVFAGLAAGAVALGAGLFEAANKAAEYGSKIYEASETTGLSAQSLSGLMATSKMTGENFDSLSMALGRASKALSMAIIEPSAITSKVLAEVMGGAQNLANLGLKPMDERLQIVMQRVFALNDVGERNLALNALLGRGWMTNIESLKMLAEQGYGPAIEKAKEMGIFFDAEGAQAAKKFSIEMHTLKTETEGLGLAIGKEMLPVLEKTLPYLLGFVEAAAQERSGNLATKWIPFYSLMRDLGPAIQKAKEEMAAAVAEAAHGTESLGGGAGAEKALKDFDGLSKMSEQLQLRLVDMGGEEAKVTAESIKLGLALTKASEDLKKAYDAGDITAEVFRREKAAMEPLPDLIQAITDKMHADLIEKWSDAQAKATDELQKRLAQFDEDTLANREKHWALEMDALRQKYADEGNLTGENERLIEQIRKAGLDKMTAESEAAFNAQLAQLAQYVAGDRLLHTSAADKLYAQYQQDLAHFSATEEAKALKLAQSEEQQAAIRAQFDAARNVTRLRYEQDRAGLFNQEAQQLQQMYAQEIAGQLNAGERLWQSYQQDLARFSQVEEQKALTVARTEQERLAIEQAFAGLRAQATQNYQNQLQQLENSQGWKGVFGAGFTASVRADQDLMKQWAQTGQQSALMVQVAMQSLDEMSAKAFQNFAQGMGQSIAQAIVYGSSIGEAMRKALAATLESIAAESITRAIYATALGFLYLAAYDYEAAGNAFASAAIFGTIGAASAVAGRFAAPPSASASSAAGAAKGSSGTASAGSASGAASAGAGQASPNVQVNIYGHIIGPNSAETLANILNDAVKNRDVRLLATQVRQTGQVIT